MSGNLDDLTSSNWNKRRPVAYLGMIFTGGMLAYHSLFGSDNPLQQTLVIIYGTLFGSIILGYLGLPSLDLRGILHARTQPQYPPAGMVDAYGRPTPPYQGYPGYGPAAPGFEDVGRNPADARPL